MFKLRRKNKTRTLTVHADELQVADNIVYFGDTLEILDIVRKAERVLVRLVSSHPQHRCSTRQVDLFPDMLVNVTR